MTSITNETHRLVVEFASFVRRHADLNLYPLSEHTQLYLVEDHDMGSLQTTWRLVNEPGWQYSNVSRLCNDRVCRAESGELLVQGKRLKAEAYLGLWRNAIKNSVSFPGLISMGFALTITIAMPAGFCRAAQAGNVEPRLTKHLDSPFIIARSDDRIIWRIPLTDAHAFMVCNDLRGTYWSREKYPGDFPVSWEVASPATEADTMGDEESSWQFELPALAEESLA